MKVDHVTRLPNRDTVTAYQDEADKWRIRITAGNGEVIFPPESHSSRADAERALERIGDAIVLWGAEQSKGDEEPGPLTAGTLPPGTSDLVNREPPPDEDA